MFERPFRRSGSGRETIPEVRVWSGVVKRPSRRYGSDRETVTEVCQ